MLNNTARRHETYWLIIMIVFKLSVEQTVSLPSILSVVPSIVGQL